MYTQKQLPESIQKFEQQHHRQPRVVIIGAGFGGLQAARALRKAPVRVTVIDRTNHHLFQPLLYQVATAALSPADISAPIRHILRKQRNAEVVLAEVTGVDLQRRRVLMQHRSLPYDYLVIATGASVHYFGHPEWQNYAPGLKSLEQARAIRQKILSAFEQAEMEHDPQRVEALLTFVVIGAGPTGVEMAGAIAEVAHKTLATEFRHIDPRQAHVMLVEAGPRVLSTYSEHLSRKAEQSLTRLGVDVRTGLPVTNIDGEGVYIGEQRVAASTVLWTTGVQASPAGTWLDAPTDRAGRVKVLPDLTVPDQPDVFVIGDTALCEQNGKPLPGIAPVAMQQGRYVAATIMRKVRGEQEIPPFHYHDKGSMATIGRSHAVVQLGPLSLTGFVAWMAWLTIHLLYLIGFRNRLLVMLQWIWCYLTFQRGARLLTLAELEMPQPELEKIA
jgi:NADH dehydrogenase